MALITFNKKTPDSLITYTLIDIRNKDKNPSHFFYIVRVGREWYARWNKFTIFYMERDVFSKKLSKICLFNFWLDFTR